ncbi:MAG: hypothetical protein Q7T01_02395 [bacterium]|nr:hypothetical protein [bacterium]
MGPGAICLLMVTFVILTGLIGHLCAIEAEHIAERHGRWPLTMLTALVLCAMIPLVEFFTAYPPAGALMVPVYIGAVSGFSRVVVRL